MVTVTGRGDNPTYHYTNTLLNSLILIRSFGLATNEGIEELRMAGNAWKLIQLILDLLTSSTSRLLSIIINKIMMRMRMIEDVFLITNMFVWHYSSNYYSAVFLLLMQCFFFLLLLFRFRLDVLLLQALLVIVGHSSSHPTFFLLVL